MVRHYRLPESVVVVELAGEIDLVTEDTMSGALAAAAETFGIRLLVCDMTNVSFFSCAGLNILLNVRAALERRNALLRVVAQSPTVVLLFDITGLAGLLGLCGSLEEALKDVNG